MKSIFITLLTFIVYTFSFSQETTNDSWKLSVSVEPLNYIFKGHSLWVGLRKYQVEFGLFSLSSKSTTHVLFDKNENLEIVLDYGLSAYGRYYILKKKSSPFVGFLIGDEQWGIKDIQTDEKRKLDNSFFTPQLGYQWVLRNRFTISPNLRFIIPFNPRGVQELNGNSYELKNLGIIPGLDLGIRFYL